MTRFSADAEASAQSMRALFTETPLQRNDFLSKRYGAEIFLKREDLTPVRSYKLRGAFNAMRKVRDATPDQSMFVCASAGNHAQGVAFACRHFGVKGVIFMPVTTPGQKVDKTRVFGGDAIEVVLTGDYFDDTLAAAQEFCAKEGAHFLSPFDDDDVIEGQATVAVELLQQMDEMPDVVVLPVGGGGLAAGMTQYLKSRSPDTQYRFVEPSGGKSFAAALRAGHPVPLNKVDTFVDGAAVAQIGSKTFAVLADTDPATVLAAPEDRICTTILTMLNHEGVVLEPAGALAIDALEPLAQQIKGKRVVCVTSGGNFDFERLPEVKERSLRFSGLKKYIVLRMPQRPGALKDFLNLLGPNDDIARFEYLKKSARNFGSVLIGIETREKAQLTDLLHRMEAAGFVFQDITDDETLAAFLI